MHRRRSAALAALLLFFAANAWAQGGPPGARVFNLFADPDTEGLIYAATSRGIFRSDNRGLSWGPASGGLTSPDTSWITGGGGRLYTATLAAGVFRSDDGGTNWTAAGTGLPDADILSLGIDPTNTQVVYAGTRNAGIFKTTDGGDSWVAVNNGLLEFATGGTTVFEGDYNQIAVDPNNPETVFAVQASNVVLGNGVLFRSTNGGQQWFGIASGASGLSVAIDPLDSNNIYAGTDAGMSRSNDGGETVQFLASFPFGASANALAIDPVDPQTIYAATGRNFVFRSTDGGDTWAQGFSGLAQGVLLTAVVDPHEPSHVYLGSNGGGVFHSMDQGENWHLRSDGMGTSDVRALAVDPVKSDNVIAGVFGGGAFRSTDGAGRWQEARAGLTAIQIRDMAFAPSDPNIAFAGSVNPFINGDGSLFKSTNGGMDWARTVRGASILSIAVDPVDPQIVYLGSSAGAFKSFEGGLSFVAINDIQNLGIGSLGPWTLTDIEIDPNDRNTLYATGSMVDFFGFPLSQVFKSTNAGLDWTGTGATQVFTLIDTAVDPFDSNRVLVGSNGGVFRRIGAGGFEPINEGLPDGGAVLANQIAFDPNAAGTVYTATSSGVFKSTNSGDTWTVANEGLSALVNKLVVDARNAGVLYAGTLDSGVFKTENGGALWTATRSFVTTDPVLTATGIVGSPDFQGGGVSPGEIVTFFALNVGPEVGVSAEFDPITGKLPTELAGVRVFFNNVLAAIFFVRSGQINCQVPYEMAGLENVEVWVEVNGVTSNVVTVRLLDSHPGVFNAILNQNLSLNTDTNPEAAGNFIVLFVTGQGLIDPALVSGEAAPFAEPLPRPTLPVSVTIDGREAVSLPVMAPGFVGLLQINVLIPPDLPPGTYEVFVEIGGRRSQVAVLVVVG